VLLFIGFIGSEEIFSSGISLPMLCAHLQAATAYTISSPGTSRHASAITGPEMISVPDHILP